MSTLWTFSFHHHASEHQSKSMKIPRCCIAVIAASHLISNWFVLVSCVKMHIVNEDSPLLLNRLLLQATYKKSVGRRGRSKVLLLLFLHKDANMCSRAASDKGRLLLSVSRKPSQVKTPSDDSSHWSSNSNNSLCLIVLLHPAVLIVWGTQHATHSFFAGKIYWET